MLFGYRKPNKDVEILFHFISFFQIQWKMRDDNFAEIEYFMRIGLEYFGVFSFMGFLGIWFLRVGWCGISPTIYSIHFPGVKRLQSGRKSLKAS
jgi:hypothetical protein